LSVRGPQQSGMGPTDHTEFLGPQIYTLTTVMRAHLQAVCWDLLKSDALNACDWGWKEVNGELVPMNTDLRAAPDDLLNVIRCKSKTSCTSALCSCRKNNFHCVTACLNCHGDSCLNTPQIPAVDTGTGLTSDGNNQEDADETLYFDTDDCEYEEVVDCDDN